MTRRHIGFRCCFSLNSLWERGHYFATGADGMQGTRPGDTQQRHERGGRKPTELPASFAM